MLVALRVHAMQSNPLEVAQRDGRERSSGLVEVAARDVRVASFLALFSCITAGSPMLHIHCLLECKAHGGARIMNSILIIV